MAAELYCSYSYTAQLFNLIGRAAFTGIEDGVYVRGQVKLLVAKPYIEHTNELSSYRRIASEMSENTGILGSRMACHSYDGSYTIFGRGSRSCRARP